jgi:apolipoprotein N-acyltransferase
MDALPKLIAHLQTWRLALIAFVAGALSVLAMAPFFLWPILFFSFPILIWVLDAICLTEADGEVPLTAYLTRLRRAAFAGWAFGFGYFLGSVYWIGYAFYVDAERYAALMPFAVAGLAAGLGLFYAAPAVLAAAMWRSGYARLLAFAFAFFCADAARGYLLTGFPWNLFGEALAANDPHMQLAAYIGVYGLTLAALLIFPAAAALIAAPGARQRRLWAPLCLAVIALAGSYAFGTQRLLREAGEVEGVRVRIVQPNIPQRERWKPENQRWIFDRILSLSRGGTSGEDIATFTHVIWPESAVPFLFGFNRDILSVTVHDILAELIPPGTTLILGAERAEGILSVDTRYSYDRAFNSLFVLGGGAAIEAIYDKAHLVPFGEYVPFHEVLTAVGFRVFSHQLDGFDAGTAPAPLIETPHAPAFMPLICYEIIFPGRVPNEQARPGWLVNVTNDAWFGDSTGPYQHLHQARIRAVEEGLPVMRAANTGISAVIDPFGRVLAQLSLGNAGVIDHGLPRALPATFYEKTRLPWFTVLFLFPLQLYLAFVAFGKIKWNPKRDSKLVFPPGRNSLGFMNKIFRFLRKEAT